MLSLRTIASECNEGFGCLVALVSVVWGCLYGNRIMFIIWFRVYRKKKLRLMLFSAHGSNAKKAREQYKIKRRENWRRASFEMERSV